MDFYMPSSTALGIGVTMANQWPEFKNLPAQNSVRRVLLEEGNGISERTGGEIEFEVYSEPSSARVEHRCSLFVPKVNYRYPLMRVIQNGFRYPVTVVADNLEQVAAQDEAELRGALGSIFQSDTVRNLVPQLSELVS